MYDECVIAEFDSEESARVGLEVLEKFDFTTDNVSVVSRYTREHGSDGAGHTSGEETVQRIVAAGDMAKGGESTALGAVLGGAVGTPLAISTIMGPFMVLGPIAALVGGAVVGGVVGSASRWGIDPDMGRKYDERVAEGSVLVIVADDELRIGEAEAALKTARPESLQRFSVPRPEGPHAR